MIDKNYHTHTYLCNHASDAPEEYVKVAIENNMKVLGFADHVPYPFSNGHISGYRMKVEQTEIYVNTLLELKEKYKNQIDIKIGYEAEYYPSLFEDMLKNIRRFPCDYIILGQHFLNNEYDGKYSGDYTENKENLITYVNQVCQAMDTGLYSYFAHPDLLQYRGDEHFYDEQMTKLCENAKKNDIPLEINILGLNTQRAYPYDEFWKIVKKVGNKVIIGCDAHSKESVYSKEGIDLAHDLAKRHGITTSQDINLRKIQ